MKYLLRVLAIGTLFFSPALAFAQTDALDAFVGNIIKLIIQPLIMFLFAAAMFFFVAGAVTFVIKADQPKERETGRRMLIWGVVGFFIMTSAVGILAVVSKTFCGTAFCL